MMKNHRLSIRTVLLIIISILNLLIAVPLGYMTYKSFKNYNSAQDVRNITASLNYLYNTKKHLSLERAAALPLLYVPSESFTALNKDIEESRKNSDIAFSTAIQIIPDDDKAHISTAIEQVNASYKALNLVRDELNKALKNDHRRATERFSNTYFQKITQLNKDIDALIGAYSRRVIFFDSETTRLMRQTRLIWEVSEYASQEYAILGRLIAQNKYPEEHTREKLLALRGRIKYGLELAHGSISSSRWENEIGPSLEEARTHYLMIFEQIKDVFYEPRATTGATLYPVTVKMWLQLASEAVNSLHEMTDTALHVNARYVEKTQTMAQRSIYLSLILFASALALSLYTWRLITIRVVKPVNAMVEALYKETKPSLKDRKENDSLDEIAKLGQVLQVFQENSRQLENERDKAQAASIAKSEFLTNMSHEIRTPMNVVVGLSNILEKTKPLTEKQHEFIKTLQISADSLLSLINDLLDFSRIEAQNFELEKTRFNLEKLVLELARVKEFKAQEKGLNFTVDISGIEDKEYIGDPTRLRQILVNLCGNAIKFTEKGSVTLRMNSVPSQIPGNESLYIEVADTGIGIPENKLDYIFEKFTQADTSIVRKYGGTGLGLAITKSLVDMMDGSIRVESTLGKGTVFKVIIPLLSKTQKKVLEVPEHASDPSHRKPLPGGKILLVEDYHPNAIVAGSLLEEFGYEYDIAENGQEAVQKFIENTYSIVLMDIQMPGMDGYEATQAIREYEKDGNITPSRIIGLTAHASPNDRDKCLKAGMDDYISKPFQAKTLKEKLL